MVRVNLAPGNDLKGLRDRKKTFKRVISYSALIVWLLNYLLSVSFKSESHLICLCFLNQQLRVWLRCLKWSWRPGRSPPAGGSVRTSCASPWRCWSSSVQPGSGAAGSGPPPGAAGRAWSPVCAGCLGWTGRWVYVALSWSHPCGCSSSKLSPFSDRSWSCGCPYAVPSTRPTSPCSWRWSGTCRCCCLSTGSSHTGRGRAELRGGIRKVWASYVLRRSRKCSICCWVFQNRQTSHTSTLPLLVFCGGRME